MVLLVIFEFADPTFLLVGGPYYAAFDSHNNYGLIPATILKMCRFGTRFRQNVISGNMLVGDVKSTTLSCGYDANCMNHEFGAMGSVWNSSIGC